MQLLVYASIAKFFLKPPYIPGWHEKMHRMETRFWNIFSYFLIAMFPLTKETSKKHQKSMLEADRHINSKECFKERHVFCFDVKPSLQDTDRFSDLVRSHKPTGWQDKCIWKRLSGMCKLWKCNEELSRPSFTMCTMSFQRATQLPLHLAHAHTRHNASSLLFSFWQ